MGIRCRKYFAKNRRQGLPGDGVLGDLVDQFDDVLGAVAAARPPRMTRSPADADDRGQQQVHHGLVDQSIGPS
jgi:hypothetical protein